MFSWSHTLPPLQIFPYCSFLIHSLSLSIYPWHNAMWIQNSCTILNISTMSVSYIYSHRMIFGGFHIIPLLKYVKIVHFSIYPWHNVWWIPHSSTTLNISTLFILPIYSWHNVQWIPHSSVTLDSSPLFVSYPHYLPLLRAATTHLNSLSWRAIPFICDATTVSVELHTYENPVFERGSWCLSFSSNSGLHWETQD